MKGNTPKLLGKLKPAKVIYVDYGVEGHFPSYTTRMHYEMPYRYRPEHNNTVLLRTHGSSHYAYVDVLMYAHRWNTSGIITPALFTQMFDFVKRSNNLRRPYKEQHIGRRKGL